MNKLRWVVILCAIVACAPRAMSAPAVVTMRVVLTDYRFIPKRLAFREGVHYRLHLENHGRKPHEFTAPVFFGAAELKNPRVLNREHTEVLLQPRDTKDVLFVAPHPGTYDLRCADHDWTGMVGSIIVQGR